MFSIGLILHVLDEQRRFINFSRSEIETAIIPIGNLVFCVGNSIFFSFLQNLK